MKSATDIKESRGAKVARAMGIGNSFPLGSTLYPEGVNFSLFCKHGLEVELLLFDQLENDEPGLSITLDPNVNRTYHYWHIFVPGLKSGQLYAYRIRGPFDPANGHRYDGDQILLDPYSNVVAVPEGYKRMNAELKKDKSHASMKNAVAELSSYNWENDVHPRTPFSKTIIYEMHVAGFTRHPSSGISPPKAGTYSGLIEKIPYLVDLGITAVELLPVFHYDEQDCPEGLTNYWGYSPISFFAPHQGYSSSDEPTEVIDEFRDMVKSFHRAGIEVILDVVFNHTAEGDHNGPTISFRGIDNSIYYIPGDDKSQYANYSGTGNTLNANQPIVRRMIMDSLHFWVTQMHVDGFRFDLASILARDEKGRAIENPPVLWDIESDPILAGTKLIAEAWDAAGLYQVGSFIGDSWKEWNGKFRDDVRRFLRGDEGIISALVTRLVGSPDLYGHQQREPEQSINFVTCHDGFTLNDLVSYNNKHNEANKESNRDGSNDNLSWNCGVEGPTQDPAIEALRNRQIRNFHVLNLFSIGAPMISMGDEMRRTQLGNNNAYCQDNEVSWMDWSLLEKYSGIHRFVNLLIHARLQRDVSKTEFNMSLKELLEKSLVSWHGVKINQPDWSSHSHSIAFTVQSLSGTIRMHFMLNAYSEPLDFEIPSTVSGSSWRQWIDTSMDAPNDICSLKDARQIQAEKYSLPSHSIAILVARNL